MNRIEYLKELEMYLQNLNADDRKDAIEYCTQYFDEAGMSNEEKAIKELGSPKQFASSLAANITIKNDSRNEEKKYKSRKNTNSDIKTIWIVLLAIAALPFGLPIIISILAVLFGLFVAAVCVIFAIGVAIFVVPFALIMGFPAIPILDDVYLMSGPNPTMIVGIILLTFSMLLLSIFVLYKAIKFFILLIKKIVIAIYNRINKSNIKIQDDSDNIINKNYTITNKIKEIYIEANAIEFEVIKSVSHSNIEISIKNFLSEEHINFNVYGERLTVKSLYGISSILTSPKIIINIPYDREFNVFDIKSKASLTLLNDISSKKIIIKNEAGKLVFNVSATDNIEMFNSVGELEINLRSESKNIIVENDRGNLSLNTINIKKYGYSIKNHAGAIYIGDKLYDGLNNDVSANKEDMNIKVDNKMGKVTIK